jgi:hypothetical protein
LPYAACTGSETAWLSWFSSVTDPQTAYLFEAEGTRGYGAPGWTVLHVDGSDSTDRPSILDPADLLSLDINDGCLAW